MSRECCAIAFLCSSLSKTFLMSRHCCSSVATLSFVVLRDVAAYVMTMWRHCSSALPISTDVAAMLRHLNYWFETLHTMSQHCSFGVTTLKNFDLSISTYVASMS